MEEQQCEYWPEEGAKERELIAERLMVEYTTKDRLTVSDARKFVRELAKVEYLLPITGISPEAPEVYERDECPIPNWHRAAVMVEKTQTYFAQHGLLDVIQNEFSIQK